MKAEYKALKEAKKARKAAKEAKKHKQHQDLEEAQAEEETQAPHDPEMDREWLAMKGEEEGVISLPSGLRFKILAEGAKEGPMPKVDTPCDCHYEGSLVDGTVFDSSYKRGEPTSFAPNQA